jgi:hypothetical protein
VNVTGWSRGPEVTGGGEGIVSHHLDRDARPRGHLAQVIDLLAHDISGPDAVSQDLLAEQDPHLGRGVPVEDALAVQSRGDALVQVIAVIGSPAQYGPGVVGGLEQPGYHHHANARSAVTGGSEEGRRCKRDQ